MSDSLTTQLGRPDDDPGVTVKATCYLVVSTDNADLLPILGLDYKGALCAKLGLAESPTRDRVPCPSCGKPLPDPVTNGGRKPCQRKRCAAGPVARGVKR